MENKIYITQLIFLENLQLDKNFHGHSLQLFKYGRYLIAMLPTQFFKIKPNMNGKQFFVSSIMYL